VFLSLIQRKPTTFFRNSVHRLFIDDVFGSTNYADMAAILSACCRVTDLFVNISFSPFIPVMDNMGFLTRLAVDLDQLFGTLSYNFTHSAFTNLTHLEVSGARRMEEILGLSLIPNLTHLAFDYLGLIIRAAQVLQTCPRLQCLVFPVLNKVWSERQRDQLASIAAEHPRFVVTVRRSSRLDWLRESPTGLDFWARSEAFIARKRAGTIDRKLHQPIVPATRKLILIDTGLAYLCVETES
jgi:hypothetical protein